MRRAARGGAVALQADPDQPAPALLVGVLIRTCAAAAGTEVRLARVADDTATRMFPLVRPS
ncbi:hypothetical protein [Actinocatenispora thailandica]|uniref:hypothetical protein n=1 Tax=Actinocatenispora thailandica TaxID=227318 RepID=UPI001951D8A2|nr:hypothetical protein [Actinocatenispora thailandica]